jgi:hypothetical protein
MHGVASNQTSLGPRPPRGPDLANRLATGGRAREALRGRGRVAGKPVDSSRHRQRLLETYQVTGEAAWLLPVQRMARAGVDRTGGPWQLPLQPRLIRLG